MGQGLTLLVAAIVTMGKSGTWVQGMSQQPPQAPPRGHTETGSCLVAQRPQTCPHPGSPGTGAEGIRVHLGPHSELRAEPSPARPFCKGGLPPPSAPHIDKTASAAS